MRICLAVAFLAFGIACATRGPGVVKTQVVTFPDGGLVEYNGKVLGRAPAAIVLPQDAEGKLTQRVEVRALPNSKQNSLYAQSRVFEPGARTERIPDRIMIDLRQPGTNTVVETAVEQPEKKAVTRTVPRNERGKPTQAVGIDRWNPGKY